MPDGTASVSPWTTSIASMGSPRDSAASMAKAVAWPWPWGDDPVRTTARPSAVISTAPNSPPGTGEVIST